MPEADKEACVAQVARKAPPRDPERFPQTSPESAHTNKWNSHPGDVLNTRKMAIPSLPGYMEHSFPVSPQSGHFF